MQKAKLLLAMCLTALCASVSMPGSASATTAGWMVNGTILTGTAGLPGTVATTPASLEDPELEISIKCNSKVVDGTNLQISAPSGGGADGLSFLECEALTPAGCSLQSPTIATLPLAFLEITLEGALAIAGGIKPRIKVTLGSFDLVGKACAIASIYTLGGTIALLAPLGQDERTLQEILITDGGRFKINSNPGRLDLTLSASLVSKQGWSFL
jgi:hypothetical protein